MVALQKWNPESYLKYGNERALPSIDLANRIDIDYAPLRIIDIGCGPGNSGRVLAGKWPGARLLGIDNSKEMIDKARADYPQQRWIVADAANFSPQEKFDVVFCNATIQWIPGHARLLDHFASFVSSRGVLAFQIPLFKDMPIGKAIAETSARARWKRETAGCSRFFTYHDHVFYYNCLCEAFREIALWETTYCHVMESHSAIIDMVQSAGMKPYLESLRDEQDRRDFGDEVLKEIRTAYPAQKRREGALSVHAVVRYRIRKKCTNDEREERNSHWSIVFEIAFEAFTGTCCCFCPALPWSDSPRVR